MAGQNTVKNILVVSLFCAFFSSVSFVAAQPNAPSVGEPSVLENPGFPRAYFYKPRNTKRQKPVFVYLHGRGAVPKEPCRYWASVVTEFGWLLCPSGQNVRGHDEHHQEEHTWDNDPTRSTKNILGALFRLRKKFGRKVQLYGNVLMGFSEGAFIAQRVGPSEVKTFNRWLILAACNRYFEAPDKLRDLRRKIKRVFLWTGEHDGVVEETRAAYSTLHSAGIDVKMKIADQKYHALPESEMNQHYRKALQWLTAKR